MKVTTWGVLAIVGIFFNAAFAFVAMTFDPQYPAILVFGHMVSMIASACVYQCEVNKASNQAD